MDALIVENQELKSKLEIALLEAEARELEQEITIAQLSAQNAEAGDRCNPAAVQAEQMKRQKEVSDLTSALETMRSINADLTQRLHEREQVLTEVLSSYEECRNLYEAMQNVQDGVVEDLHLYQEAFAVEKAYAASVQDMVAVLEGHLSSSKAEVSRLRNAILTLSVRAKEKMASLLTANASLDDQTKSLAASVKGLQSQLAPRWRLLADASAKGNRSIGGSSLRARMAEVESVYLEYQVQAAEAGLDEAGRAAHTQNLDVIRLACHLQLGLQYAYEAHVTEMMTDATENPLSVGKDRGFLRWIYNFVCAAADLMLHLHLLMKTVETGPEVTPDVKGRLDAASEFAVKHLVSFNEDRMLTVPCTPLEDATTSLQAFLGIPDIASVVSSFDTVDSLVLAALLIRLLPVGLCLIGNVKPDMKMRAVFTDQAASDLFQSIETCLVHLPFAGLFPPTEAKEIQVMFRTWSAGTVPAVTLPRSKWRNAFEVLEFLCRVGDAFRCSLLGYDVETFSSWTLDQLQRVESLIDEKPQDEVDQSTVSMLGDFDATFDLLERAVATTASCTPFIMIEVAELEVAAGRAPTVNTEELEELQKQLEEALRIQAETAAEKTELERKWTEVRYELESQKVLVSEVEGLRKAEGEMTALTTSLREEARYNVNLNESLTSDVQQCRRQIKDLAEKVDRYRKRQQKHGDGTGDLAEFEISRLKSVLEALAQDNWALSVELAGMQLENSQGTFKKLEAYVESKKLMPIPAVNPAPLGPFEPYQPKKQEPPSTPKVSVQALMSEAMSLEGDIQRVSRSWMDTSDVKKALTVKVDSDVKLSLRLQALQHKVASLRGMAPVPRPRPVEGHIIGKATVSAPSDGHALVLSAREFVELQRGRTVL
ncbi:MAG: uncharacterized protein KVP18_004913 [Porospora cf. gigantea A]|nr:MAG: hypothetical protein KVP18_004913 [Porospora cf. gigantea A]